ncbi:hypothetical protein FJ250_08220, partial [bacterium]|nr:hypothetical protein [bacterium]
MGGSRWWPVLAGLLLGVLLGVVLLGVRFGAPWRWPQGGAPDTLRAGRDTVLIREVPVEVPPRQDPGEARNTAIVRATRDVAPAVVSINVVQR